MKLKEWYAKRSARYVARRAAILLRRYRLSPSVAEARIESLMAALVRCGCAPTFPTPGGVVDRNWRFFRRLQDLGAEIAVHGYEHLDLSVYPPDKAREQLQKAADAFVRHGIEVHGFRCPYLGCTEDLLDALPAGMFAYSSNKAMWWDMPTPSATNQPTAVFDTLYQFYRPESASDAACLPYTRSNLIEIPVCLPDDLQMYDGLHLGSEGMAQVWSKMLNETYRRGELFVLQFHPEISFEFQQSCLSILDEAGRFRPAVWVCQLRDIARWWQEKSKFSLTATATPAGLHLTVNCSDRATVLIRSLEGHDSAPVWTGAYRRVTAREFDVPSQPRPFVGLPANAPTRMVSLLQERGYIVDTSATATQCATFVDGETLSHLTHEIDLVNQIESSPSPLVRFWPWPDGARSALCLTGDLDALSLRDYAARLFRS